MRRIFTFVLVFVFASSVFAQGPKKGALTRVSIYGTANSSKAAAAVPDCKPLEKPSGFH